MGRIALGAGAAQSQQRLVQADQGIKKTSGFFGRFAEHRQSGIQGAQQAGQRRKNLLGLAQDFGPHTPQQRGDRRAVASRVGIGLVGLAQLRRGDHQRPRAIEEVQHQLRRIEHVGSKADFPGHLVCQFLAVLGKSKRLQLLIVCGLLGAVFRLPALSQAVQRLCKRRCVAGVGGIELVDRVAYRLNKGAEILSEFVVETETALGDLLHQAACWVVGLAEVARLGQRQSQQSRLQRHHRFTHRREQQRIAGHLAHQFAHQIEPDRLRNLLRLLLESQQHPGALLGLPVNTPTVGPQWRIDTDLTRWPIHRWQILVACLLTLKRFVVGRFLVGTATHLGQRLVNLLVKIRVQRGIERSGAAV